jgi:hypothetical protein
MTEKENRAKLFEHDVRAQEVKVREAKVAMDNGYKELHAKFENDYAKLKAEYERQQIFLDREKQSLEFARIEAARGYEA